MEKKSLQPKFDPYRIYTQNQKNIEEFAALTGLSYDLTRQLLFKHPKDQLPKISLPKPREEELSFSMADQEPTSVKLKCGWLSFSEYAEECNLALEQVEREASEGKFGLVLKHPKTGKDVVVWPPEMQSKPLSALPEPGKYIMQTTIKGKAEAPLPLDPVDMDGFEQIQKSYLVLAHSLGKPSEVATHAEEMLNQSCFLLQWTIFEVFLRSTIQELIKRHPSKIASDSRGKKSTLNYEEILEMSSKFSSVEDLRDSLIQREIERVQAGGESVHGLINFLKTEFRFKRDPYKAWYVLNGQRYITHYNDLIELKEVRNALIHDGGTPPESFFVTHPAVPKRGNAIVIDEEYCLKAKLILSPIAFSIAKSIDEGMYDAGD
ncbi:MAG: hypothetical protein U9N41_06140 [Euryarchaeota archaeon]|nr:hypothetical protein [Euryarchaeota archaeon]